MGAAATTFYVKHMVCSRGILLMRELLLALGLTPLRVELGVVEVAEPPSSIGWDRLRTQLLVEGFELLERQAPRHHLVQDIKRLVAELLDSTPAELRCGRGPQLLSQRLGRKFAYLSNVFSAAEGQSLERYIIGMRIAAAEQLLRTSTQEVGRIAQALGYSSLGHLSRQFRLVKGVSPTDYRRQLAASPTPNLTASTSELYEPHLLPNQ
jgi:AraC family transcriptional regulator